MNRRKEVDLDDARPGMVLSDAVLDKQHAVLLPEQTVLTEVMLRALARRGIDHVFVVDDEMSPEEWEKECVRIRQQLDRLFRRCTGKGASDMLLQHVAAYRMGGQR
jgi:hypothetical protein